MDRAATALELQRGASRHTGHGGHAGPEWRRYPQSQSYLPALERVCGTEADIAAMRASTAAPLKVKAPVGMAAAFAAACVWLLRSGL